MPSRQLNRLLWAAVVVLIVVFGLKARDSFDTYLAAVGRLDVREDANVVHLTWTGEIEAPMASKLAEVFARHETGNSSFVLALNSPGGALDHGAEVVRLLHRIGETHRLETVVEAGDACASMCVPVYLQGQRRSAAASARFLFHEVSFHEFMEGARTNIPASATATATGKFFDKYFTPVGVDPAWQKAVLSQMVGGHNIWKTAQELVDEKSGIVQQIF